MNLYESMCMLWKACGVVVVTQQSTPQEDMVV